MSSGTPTASAAAPVAAARLFSSRSTGYFASGDSVSALNLSKGNASLWTATLSSAVVAGPVATANAVWVGTGTTLVALNPATGAVLNTIQLPSASGGGGAHSGTPRISVFGDNLLVAPTGSTITAFGSTGSRF
jgi:hypothetical protein